MSSKTARLITARYSPNHKSRRLAVCNLVQLVRFRLQAVARLPESKPAQQCACHQFVKPRPLLLGM